MMKEKREEEIQLHEEQVDGVVDGVEVWDCGSPLYDSYELAALGHLIDRHTMALPSPCGSHRFSFRVVKTASFRGLSGVWGRRKVAVAVGSGGSKKDKTKAKTKKKNIKYGFLGLPRVVMCLGAQSDRPI